MNNKWPKNSPQDYAEMLYWSFSEVDTLDIPEVKKCCYKAIDLLINSTDDEGMKLYYDMVKKLVERRGV